MHSSLLSIARLRMNIHVYVLHFARLWIPIKKLINEPDWKIIWNFLFTDNKDDKEDFMMTEPIDLMDGNMITVARLAQNTKYIMKIVSVNDEGQTQGPEQTTKTLGGGNKIYIYMKHGWLLSVHAQYIKSN